MKIIKKLSVVIVIASLVLVSGCQKIANSWSEFKGSLIGNTYEISFYDNYGAKFLTVNGNRIDIDGNYTEDDNGNQDLSSVITITIDGKEIESCGDTVIFAGAGLEPDVDFSLNETIDSDGHGLLSITSVGKVINEYKNYFGKKRVVVIQSQLGVPICAFAGDDIYWEIPDELPKMTKLMVDGKPLYIHRANFQIIDASLLK